MTNLHTPTGQRHKPCLLALAISAALLAGYSTAHAATFTVTVATDNGTGDTAGTLSKAILDSNSNADADTIELQTDVTVTGVMKTLFNSSVTLQSAAGSTHFISGNNRFRPLFVKSGTVTIKNLTVKDGNAQGGRSTYGGSGAGLGGGLFVYDGTVTVENVAFNNNGAFGGSYSSSEGLGGGGMYGDGDGFGGGGLFAGSIATSYHGAYGGNGNYGGFGGTLDHPGGGFGGGGWGSDYAIGGNGGFGGGGGNYHAGGFGGGSGYSYGDARNGGFGGGGAFANGSGGNGGFGGGGGFGYGGGGAGFGGAVFAMKGTTTLKDVTFSGNIVSGGLGARGSTTADDGIGRAKDVFICTADLDADKPANGNRAADLCSAVVNQCGTTSTTEIVGTFGTTCPVSSYAITTAASPTAGGLVSCTPNPVDAGGSTTCTATPNAGYVFSSWSGDCSGGAGCTLDNVTADKSVTGNFKQLQTVAFDAATPTSKTLGDAPFDVTVTTTASGLSATLRSNTPEVCTVSGNTVTLVTAGTCTLIASQAGNVNYEAAAQVRKDITVTAITQGSVGNTTVTIDRGHMLDLHEESVSSYTTGKPSGMAFDLGSYSYRVVGLSTSTPESVTVTLTFASPIPTGAKLYKVTASGYTEITGVTFGSNTATFSITDNGSLDTNPALGTIDDPVALGAPPANGGTGGGTASSGGGGSFGWAELLLGFAVLGAALRRRLASWN